MAKLTPAPNSLQPNAEHSFYDHVHRDKEAEGRPYELVDAGKLITDFWTEVDRVLGLDEE